MDRKRLSQLYYLKREAALLREELARLRTQPPSITAQANAMPRGGGEHDKVGAYAAKCADIEDAIALQAAECAAEYERLLSYIRDVPDCQMRMILTLRYIHGMSWVGIALKLGGGNTADGVRMIHNRFLGTK